MRSSTSRLLAAIALTVLLAGAAAACSDSDDPGGGGDSAGPPAEAQSADDSEAGGGGGGDADASADSSSAEAAPAAATDGINLAAASDRDIIFTASVDLEVERLNEAAREARGLAEAAGGFVFGEDTQRQDSAQTVLTLKVPPAEFGRVLQQLGDLGRVDAQQISSDDVTEQVVSLDSRIRTAEASVLRLRGLIARAERIEDIAFLENELLNRETNLETLRGEQRTLERQVDLATVTVTMRAADPAPVEPPQEARDLPSFLDGFDVGWTAMLFGGAVLLTLLGALAPYVPLLLIALLVWRIVAKRRPRPATPTPMP